jgi:alkylhydroperoxidase family enzyme
MQTPDAERLFVPIARESAADTVQPVLQHVEKVFGFVPNLMGTFANAPAAAKGYHALIVEFTKGSLTPQEQQLVLLTTSVENRGQYCTLAHSAAAKGLARVPGEIVQAVREGALVPDAKLNALVALTRDLVRHKGAADPELVTAFLATGYRKEQILEILVGIAVKTISNYLDHLSPIEADPAFQKERAA